MNGNDASRSFQKRRIKHWDGLAGTKYRFDRPAGFYHELLQKYYAFLIAPGLRVLELGCGQGDLLHSIKPAFGLGIDFSKKMIQRATRHYPELYFCCADAHTCPLKIKFDVIILSDLVNDVWDLQQLFEEIKPLCHAKTRIVLNFFNEVWRPPLAFVRRKGWAADVMEQSWLSSYDVINLIELAGFESLNSFTRILFPLDWPLLSTFFNRYLVHFPPFSILALTIFVIARPVISNEEQKQADNKQVSVIVPARNEAGNIKRIIESIPPLGQETEIIFIEGGSTDNTFNTIQELIHKYPEKSIRLYQQEGTGKGDAVRLGFEEAQGDILMILDADLTVLPSYLPRFYEAIRMGRGEFINGVRLVYPMEDRSMRFFNKLGNKFFSWSFSWLLGQPVKDTLCGTKVLSKSDYQMIAKNRSYFGEFDPFGDFDLLFGAAKLNMKIVDMPIRYRARQYGNTNISRWKHGLVLLKMVIFAARRMRFI